MNPIEIENRIAAAIANRPPQTGKRYRLCYEQGRIWCHPLGGSLPPTHIIGIFTDDNIVKGFTANEWTMMAGEIWAIIENEKGLKQDAKSTKNNNDRRGGEAPPPNTA